MNSIAGKLELIIGGMMSGKSTELMRVGDRYKIINKRVCFVNSIKDTRATESYGYIKDLQLGNIQTHNNETKQCIKCKHLSDLVSLLDDFDVFAIDEGQFFDDLQFTIELVNTHNKIVIISGLDGDYKQQKFGHIIDLIPQCDSLIKLHAMCKICNDGTLASFSKRVIQNENQEMVGGNESYIAVCRKHIHTKS